jgi:hypothetical protein
MSGGNVAVPSSKTGNGPSSGLAGRLPGIVSSVVPLLGTVGDIASLMLTSTLEVSHESKASECVVAADRILDPRDKVVREPSSLIRELVRRNETNESLQDDRFDSAFDDVDGESGAAVCESANGGAPIRSGVGGVGRLGSAGLFSLRADDTGVLSSGNRLSMTNA